MFNGRYLKCGSEAGFNDLNFKRRSRARYIEYQKYPSRFYACHKRFGIHAKDWVRTFIVVRLNEFPEVVQILLKLLGGGRWLPVRTPGKR